MRNIATILDQAGRGTLALLDELGAGTDPVEGAALGQAVLEELESRRTAVIVTTHLGQLKQFAFALPSVENACVEFDAETMEPTYRLLIGQPGNSNALEIARRCGLGEPILDRAANLVSTAGRPTEEMIDQLMESRVALEKSRRESDQRLNRSRNLEKAASERIRHLEKREGRLEREADQLADSVVRDLQVKADPFLRELGNVPKALKPAADGLRRIIGEALKETSLGKKRRAFIETLKKGDRVWVPKFEQYGFVRKFHRGDEKISVEVGKMTMEIAYDDVSWVRPEEST